MNKTILKSKNIKSEDYVNTHKDVNTHKKMWRCECKGVKILLEDVNTHEKLRS